jgi:hypothetical protein
MNRNEAKEILALYRRGIDNPADPEFAEALELVKHDRELASWFEQQSAVYEATRQKFQAIEAPSELVGWILSGRKRRNHWWRSPVIWGAAAAIAILIAIVVRDGSPKHSFAAYRSRMVRTAMSNYGMPLMTNDLAAIRSYLTTNNAHGDYVLPAALAKLPGQGCVAFPWHDRPVALICLDGGPKRDVFLFVINRKDLSDPPKQRELTKIGPLPTASWSDDKKTYLLATKGDEQFLQTLLP